MKFLHFCCLIVIATAIIVSLEMTVHRNRPEFKRPRCYIKEFYVPALDLSLNPISNHSSSSNNNKTIIVNPCLFFDLSFHNMLEHGLDYGRVNITFSYGRNNAVANDIVPSFYQWGEKTDYRRRVVESRGVPWETAMKAVSNGSTVVFRVDLVAWPSYYKRDWNHQSKKKNMSVGADVEVDGSGMKVKRGDIRLLESGVATCVVGIFVLFLSLLVSLQCLFV